MTQWQTIDSAPRDPSTPVLLAEPDGTVGMGFRELDDEAGLSWKAGEDLSGWSIYTGEGERPSTPTHWRPLPRPPEAA